MENCVNKGSPSGFSGDQSVLGEFAAGRLNSFKIPIVESEIKIKNFSPESCVHNYFIKDDLIPVHPLFYQELCVANNKNTFRIVDYVDAFVTASGRTVLVQKEKSTHFLKLHLPYILGRVNRHIPLRKGIAGVEISTLVSQHIKSSSLGIGLLPEIKCVGIYAADNGIDDGSWSYVERCGSITTSTGNDTESILIPAFSTFANDPLDNVNPVILDQLCDICNIDTLDKFCDVFIQPLIEAYLKLTFNFGLMPEINAQNLLFAYNKESKIIYPVLRDMGRVEKLPYINESVGMLISCPYKTNKLDKPEDYDYAKTRHSFSFDFKLCGYVIKPLLETFCKYKRLDFDTVMIQISQSVGNIMNEYSNLRDYMPHNRVVKGHPQQLLTVERPYIDCGKPYII